MARLKKEGKKEKKIVKYYTNDKIVLLSLCVLVCGVTVGQQLKGNQEDPCKIKGRITGDVTYCDRYWECVNNQPELYDCPNGLVFAGKHRGVTEGCDYPWRANYCEGKQLASELNCDFFALLLIIEHNIWTRDTVGHCFIIRCSVYTIICIQCVVLV